MSSHLYTFVRLILPTWPKSAKSKDNWLFSRLSFYFIGGYRISITKLTECKLKKCKTIFWNKREDWKREWGGFRLLLKNSAEKYQLMNRIVHSCLRILSMIGVCLDQVRIHFMTHLLWLIWYESFDMRDENETLIVPMVEYISVNRNQKCLLLVPWWPRWMEVS